MVKDKSDSEHLNTKLKNRHIDKIANIYIYIYIYIYIDKRLEINRNKQCNNNKIIII